MEKLTLRQFADVIKALVEADMPKEAGFTHKVVESGDKEKADGQKVELVCTKEEKKEDTKKTDTVEAYSSEYCSAEITYDMNADYREYELELAGSAAPLDEILRKIAKRVVYDIVGRVVYDIDGDSKVEKKKAEKVEEKKEEPTALSLNAQDTAALNDVIAKVMEAENNPPEEKEEEKEEPVVEEPKKKPDHHIINTFINISYVLLLSLMILLLGLVVHIALGNMMDQPVVKVLHAISLGYIDVVESIFEFIFNGLHSITNVIPDYYTYMNDNTLMTLSALKMIHCYIMNVVIVSIVEVIKYSILSKKSS